MKGLIGITAGVSISFVLIFLALGASISIALSALVTILSAAFAMIFYAWRKSLDQAKGDFRVSVLGLRGMLRGSIDRNEPKLSKFFISDSEEKERQVSSVLTVFLGFWGFVTTLAVGSLEAIQVFSTKFGETSAPILSLTGAQPGKLPPPTTEVGFTFFVLYFVVPLSMFIILNIRLLGLGNLRKIGKHNIISVVPRYPLEKMGGLAGIASFATFFFHGLLSNNNPIEVQLALLYSLFYVLVVGVPIGIFSLFFVYAIEPKIRARFRDYLTAELGIKVTSIKNLST